jgi:hypothetical protein
MTVKTLALLLSALTSLVLSTLTYMMPNPSDAYQVGYAEGRFDLYNESKAMKKFNQCVAEKVKAPEDCWKDQIEWTKVLYQSWDAMTDKQKVDHVSQSSVAQPSGIKWADVLRGKGDSNVMPPLPVEIK